MRKPRKIKPVHSGARAFLVIVSVAAARERAGLWAWQRGQHRPPTLPQVSLYSEPGWLPENKSDRWTCIVIHHSADESGSAEKYDTIHREQNGWDELGYHFVIGNGSLSGDGQVEVGPRWVKQKYGAHTLTLDHSFNQHGIGICLVGNFENHPPDARQMESLARLVRFLCHEFAIPLSKIYTHGGVTHKTACPGKHFDVELLKRRWCERAKSEIRIPSHKSSPNEIAERHENLTNLHESARKEEFKLELIRGDSGADS